MDVFGITYLIENAQQFWSELDDILHFPSDATLSQLDAALRRFVALCGVYHEQYLQSPLQLEHAGELLLDSELFKFHSERMCEILLDDSQSSTDPHCQFILFTILLRYGRRHPSFLRSHKRWQPLIPLFMDHVLIDIDPDVEDTFTGYVAGSRDSVILPGGSAGGVGGWAKAVSIPIEVKLRTLSVRLLYEVCRVQKLSVQDLRIFDDAFIDRLFDLVEETRNLRDETFNYSVIKLIVALNEQFMVASINPTPPDSKIHTLQAPKQENQNRVLLVLMRRLGSSMTFGENMIFMLNRAGRTPEDRCMQLLVLKILYLLFTTKGTSEYFYTNDLCVLVDVFLRELVDLDEENESLRHTFLRVLHPLLTKTQLRTVPYKRPQIVRALESLIENADIRDINSTTKRLVERCLSGDWCVQFRKTDKKKKSVNLEIHLERMDSPGFDSTFASSTTVPTPTTTQSLLVPPGSPEKGKQKTLKTSRSAEHLKVAPAPNRTLQDLRKPSNESSLSLPSGASAKPPAASSGGNSRRGTVDSVDSALEFRSLASSSNSSSSSTPALASPSERHAHHALHTPHRSDSLGAIEDGVKSSGTPHHAHASSFPEMTDMTASLPGLPVSSNNSLKKLTAVAAATRTTTHHRSAPPTPPPRRRKPPAVPTSRANGTTRVNGGVTMTTIASSTGQPTVGKHYRAVVQ
ncbi:hypothetical protein JAAARDRAFT_36278 [Jaapia argillacea MUCL 33604]|uniref:SPIN90/Ldb17 leucine-rich domain-containing protein n=1 Tax=Jaapia argillacea MUCL 33604 TaxID=933084 RepID=A0A067PZW0_9AGAM|nr:hypothetical protein JAAARDRAFT_36278 [Jaapia argillacea MUCL 33604]